MTTQATVNEIHEAMKTDWSLVVYYRSERGRSIKRIYESADVLQALAIIEALKDVARKDEDVKALMKDIKELALDPIASVYREVRVGSTPLAGEGEVGTGGYGE